MLSGYISRSACNGKRPSQHFSSRGRKRPALIARLLRERSVARFIVAPCGYGKTHLALEYAETVFDWEHVFWLNAKSPCFLRDLDAGVIIRALDESDTAANLVIIEDLPLLDTQRSERLSDVIDVLLEARVEVLVTCTPLCDTVSRLQIDCVKVGSRDILLDDGELDVVRTPDERNVLLSRDVPPAQRVAALAWAESPDTASRFAAGCFDDDMPADLAMAMFVVLVLQSGSLADVRRIVGFDHEDVLHMLADYPHLGLDDGFEHFDAALLPVADIAASVKPRLQTMVDASACGDRMQFVEAAASILVEKNRSDRACDLVRALYPREHWGEWLVSCGYEMVSQGRFQAPLGLLQSVKAPRSPMRARLRALEALCLRVLGDGERAVMCAKPSAFDVAAPYDVRVCCLLVIAKNASPSLVERAHAELRKLAATAYLGDVARFGLWKTLARGCVCAEDGVEALMRFWHDALLEGVDDAALCIIASWLFDAVKAEDADLLRDSGRPVARADGSGARRVGSEVREYVRSRLIAAGADKPDFFTSSAGLSLEQMHERCHLGVPDAFPAHVIIALRNAEMDVLAQRASYERGLRLSRVKRKDWQDTHPDALLGAPMAHVPSAEVLSIPTLSIKLFGRFAVEIGGVPLPESAFNRRNVQVLLVLLAVNQGRELTRDVIARAMWPTSSPSVARKNFYTVWAQLRKALSLPDGTCPYLIRRQYSCSLEERYVKSDVARLADICRELSFGVPDEHLWATLYYEIDRDFSNELLPSERNNEFILQAREEYRVRLIDSLVAASASMLEAGNTQWAMWYARAAVKRDKTREDAYIALMKAQNAARQRTAAMTTYLKCRRILSDELGVDPSPELSEFYERLLRAGVEVN